MEVSKQKPLRLEELEGTSLNAADAFLAMSEYLSAYLERTRGECPVALVCSDSEVQPNGMTSDPAALSDWRDAVDAVLAKRRNA
jgi:hypothetical protein